MAFITILFKVKCDLQMIHISNKKKKSMKVSLTRKISTMQMICQTSYSLTTSSILQILYSPKHLLFTLKETPHVTLFCSRCPLSSNKTQVCTSSFW